ncbi:hypothetical protein RCO28_30990 [Streptomyces sp. LHD-70]|uniref:hypothetical protein n=1 Tax=Streptomyces sp. LHD-70 TaxID=3072140 RepID=UPI00280C4AC2|nr:hypothetical protein [Streptomyces sp. LHD-70]MDQ8706864.1 hypothetical protein [Streptomyces sp. LHD-70]
MPEHTLRLCDDEQVRQESVLAEQAAERARYLADAQPDDEELSRRLADLLRAHEAAQKRLADASVSLTFRALPRPVLEEVITAHPPTEAQAAEGAAFNPDTFPATLIAASSVDGMNETEAGELLTSWSASDANALWEAAWQVQQIARAEVSTSSVGKG